MFFFRKKISFRLEDIYTGHHKVTYKGVPAIKCPFDYTLYQMIIQEVQPDLVIEIGTNKGGSTLYIADLLELNKKGVIHTIDLPGNNEAEMLHSHARIKIFKEGFENYKTELLSNYKAILIIEDGSHQYKDTLATLNKFAPFISKDSYFIVEDGIVNELGWVNKFNGGPQKAIKEFLIKNHTFIIDKNWCNFFGNQATFNINGYLKKIY
ncbi:MAG: CmcI family methyltransferase [Chitinophagaceae bacterium]